MTFLFVDPGPVQSGWARFEVKNGVMIDIRYGIDPNNSVCEKVDAVVAVGDGCVGYERLTARGNSWGDELIDSVRMTGRIDQICYQRFRVPERPSRGEVCVHHCGFATTKGHIWACMEERFGKAGTKKAPGRLFGIKDHARDAFEGAVYLADKHYGTPVE